jgi:hypothetical protein
MSDYSLLFDVAKVRQSELARDFEIARKHRNLGRNTKNISLTKKMRTILKSIS